MESNRPAGSPDNLDCKEVGAFPGAEIPRLALPTSILHPCVKRSPACDDVTPGRALLAGMGRNLQKREF
jgi:hypothetical protein